MTAAKPVADVPEHHRTERPHQIGNRKPPEGDEQRPRAGAEEHAAEDGGEVEIQGEVIRCSLEGSFMVLIKRGGHTTAKKTILGQKGEPCDCPRLERSFVTAIWKMERQNGTATF